MGVGRGLAFVVTGPSGAGKSSVINRVMEQLPNLAFSVSYTTRPRRKGETDGVDYIYISHEKFTSLIDSSEFIEYTTYLEDRYGTSRSQVERVMMSKKDVILDIEINGARSLRQAGLGKCTIVYIFIAPSTLDRLGERLRARGTESDTAIAARLRIAEQALADLDKFDYLVINDDLDTAVDELRAIIAAERTRIRSANH
ncbi:guanylate kinase [Candidatus Bipolaricaulota bacterium]|nr:guanylate kinase [Candidatus Bipolaricaulota bacterium]